MRLTAWYANVIRERRETLCAISKYLVADAWISKKPFTDQITEINMQLVSRLRDVTDLKCLHLGPATGGKGRPKKYAGKIDIANIDTDYFVVSITTANLVRLAAATSIYPVPSLISKAAYSPEYFCTIAFASRREESR